MDVRRVHTAAHQVALEADEVDPHGDGVLGVAAEHLDPVHQVCTELVSPLQHAQHHDVMVAQVVHDVPGQTFCPVTRVKRPKRDRKLVEGLNAFLFKKAFNC